MTTEQLTDIPNDKFCSRHVRWAMQTLKERGVSPFEENFYRAAIHTDVKEDLANDATIANVFQYGYPVGVDNPLLKGSVPVIWGVKFYEYEDEALVMIPQRNYVGVLTSSTKDPSRGYFTWVYGPPDE